jgi:hypothetical protein
MSWQDINILFPVEFPYIYPTHIMAVMNYSNSYMSNSTNRRKVAHNLMIWSYPEAQQINDIYLNS